MLATKNDLPVATRKKVISLLSASLADVIDLKLQAKQAHWNVKGANFIALHELFDKVVAEADEAGDTIAERIMQLGGSAAGGARLVAKQSRLKDYPLLVADGLKHADALSSAIAAFNTHARRAIDAADEAGDAVSADMLTGIVAGFDKLLWFVEAHIQK